MDARILLVEDDDDLRDAMVGALVADGHRVQACAEGNAALAALAEGLPELVLLDIGLGDGPDGVDVCRRLRNVDAGVYVMMLTARDGEAEVVMALEAGADDYVTKPVGLAELRSRVRAALRRVRPAPDPHGAPRPVLTHETLELDPRALTARVGDTPLELTRSEFAVLEALLRADGAVCSRVQLIRAIYDDDAFRDPRGVDVHVHFIRDKLERAGGSGAWIATVRGAGYRIGR